MEFPDEQITLNLLAEATVRVSITSTWVLLSL